MTYSIQKYKRNKKIMKEHLKYRRIGTAFGLFDWTVFSIIVLRLNVVAYSVQYYLSSSRLTTLNGVLDAFSIPRYTLALIALSTLYCLKNFEHINSNRYLLSLRCYFIPTVIGGIASLFYKGVLSKDIAEIPLSYQTTAYFDYYSLFFILIVYGGVRVGFGFDFYVLRVQLYKNNYKWLIIIYAVTVVVLAYVSMYCPNLYPND